MSKSKSGSDDSSSSSSDGSIPSEQVKAAAEEDDSSASSSSSEEEEEEQQQQQQQEEGYIFNGKLYPTYQEMVAAKQERNRQVLERTTSEISLMLGSEYGSSSMVKKKPPSKKLKQPSGPPRRNPKRKARSPSSSSISASSHQEDTPRKRSKSIGSSSRNSINSSGGSSISGKVPSDVFMNNNESMATQSTIDNDEKLLLQPYNKLVKDICIQTEQILVNGKRIRERERMYQEFRRRNGGDRICSTDRSQTKQTREEDEHDDMSTHEDITSTVDWKLFHSSISVGCVDKNISPDWNTAVEKIVPKFNSFMDDEDDIIIPEEYLATEPNKQHPTQQQLSETLPINNPVKYNNIIQEQNKYYNSKGIDRYWDEQYGDGIDPDLLVKEHCKGSEPSTDGNTFNITGSQDQDLVEAKKGYIDSLLQRCWDRAVHAASSTLTVPLSDEIEEGLEGAVKTEETDLSPPNQKDVIDTALHQKARDVVDGILDTLFLAKDSSLRLMLEDPKLKQRRVDWRDVLNCLQAATEKQGTRKEGELDQSLIKSISTRLIERYGIANNG